MPAPVSLQFRVIGVAKDCLFPCCPVCQRKFPKTDCLNPRFKFWCVRCQRSIPVRAITYRYALKLKVLLDDSATWLTLYGRGVDCVLGTSPGDLHRCMDEIARQQLEDFHVSVEDLLYHALSSTLLGTLLHVRGRWLGEAAIPCSRMSGNCPKTGSICARARKNNYSMVIVHGRVTDSANTRTILDMLDRLKTPLGQHNTSQQDESRSSLLRLTCSNVVSCAKESKECSFASAGGILFDSTSWCSPDGLHNEPLWHNLSLSLDCTNTTSKENQPLAEGRSPLLEHMNVEHSRRTLNDSISGSQKVSVVNNPVVPNDLSIFALEENNAEWMDEASLLEEKEYSSNSQLGHMTTGLSLPSQYDCMLHKIADIKSQADSDSAAKWRPLTDCLVASTPGFSRLAHPQRLPKRFSLELTPILPNSKQNLTCHQQISGEISQTSSTNNLPALPKVQQCSSLSPDLFSYKSDLKEDAGSPELFSGASLVTEDLLQESSLCRRLFEQSASSLADGLG